MMKVQESPSGHVGAGGMKRQVSVGEAVVVWTRGAAPEEQRHCHDPRVVQQKGGVAKVQ